MVVHRGPDGSPATAHMGRRPNGSWNRHWRRSTGVARRIAVLTALAVLLPAVAAEAKTHRFARSQEVVVRFKLLKPSATGMLIRFARNRLTLSRGRSGKLELQRKGSRTRRVRGSGRRSVHIRVALSVPNRRANLAAGRRKASLPSRFVAEDTVVVRRGRTIRGLRIWTDRSGVVEGGDPEEPSPGSPPSEPARLFAPDSVWNAPLADSAALDPDGEVLVGTLRDTVTENLAAGWGPWIERGGTTPLYVVGAGQPTVRVQLDPGSWKLGLQQTFEAVPIPPDAVPALGPDAHMTVWQPSTDRLWEFFHARELSDGWHARLRWGDRERVALSGLLHAGMPGLGCRRAPGGRRPRAFRWSRARSRSPSCGRA